jgi:hypothetical protein
MPSSNSSSEEDDVHGLAANGQQEPSSITPLYARPRPRRPRLPPNFPVSRYANVQPLPFMGKESVC